MNRHATGGEEAMSAFDLRTLLLATALAAALAAPGRAAAGVMVQCPGDVDGDAIPDGEEPDPGVVCKHLTAGDGFAVMADGKELYTFGFSDVTGVDPELAMTAGMLAAHQPAPTLELREGDRFYLTLTNVGMMMRPDLFDAHTVHFHGFPNAAAVFDGVPEASISINMGSSITYYYEIAEPGTYLYHCHFEATEHMQMGMLGQLYVKPAQDGQTKTYRGNTYTSFVYNDGDGSTGYHKAYALQLNSFDHVFHEQHYAIQPLPFAAMTGTYSFINGRGYPDTVNPDPLPAATENMRGVPSQPLSALVTLDRATEGTTLLLRFSNVSVTEFFTVTALGLPMQVVGQGARILRGPGGKDLYYRTSAVTLGGGETTDVLVDASGVPAGTYFLYTTNLNYLSNGDQDYGGLMTEIVIQ
jgi:FtsP/CotA-like multicopper oxidase with cupredoxin domain